ncbi:uncharacterized protein LOC124264540 [Haliotis rubra]|uniref:uncharacterized protein LOC124264540 n=1 Tax=Haliotis rubra TaxID=36100 RepID=UPI001EE4F5D7|nr:uncharacterized protein LOC124264540 [Haliotis rubra]
MSRYIVVLFVLLELQLADLHTVPLTTECPAVDHCNGKFVLTLQQLHDRKLNCGKYARYLACVEDKLTECHKAATSTESQSSSTETSTVSTSESSSDETSESPTTSPTTSPSDTTTHAHPHEHNHTDFHSEQLVKMKTARASLCSKEETGVITIDAKYVTLFEQFYNKKERYANFEYYPYLRQNLSMQAGCGPLANCSLALKPYAQFSETYFPCPALLEFEDCFKLNRDDCPELRNVTSLPASVNVIDQECEVGTSSTLTTPVTLLLVSMWCACVL